MRLLIRVVVGEWRFTNQISDFNSMLLSKHLILFLITISSHFQEFSLELSKEYIYLP